MSSDLLNGDVLPPVRRLLLAFFLACSGVVLTQLAAHADTEKDAERADLVFTGTVSEVLDAGTKASYAVEADLVWKGILTKPDLEVTAASRKCPLNLERNQVYIFFVTQVGRDRISSECSGTVATSDDLEQELDGLLGESKPVDPPETPQKPAEFTMVAGAEPTPFTRLAAPGGALVLIGLLGLLVVGRASRR